MLPIELANLILYYLNKKYYLLLTNLIKMVNDFYFYNLNNHIDIITTNFTKFDNIKVISQNAYGKNFARLDVVKDGTINKNFIKNFILTYLTIVQQVSNHLIDQTLVINQFLTKVDFDNYIVLLYNDNRKVLIKWCK